MFLSLSCDAGTAGPQVMTLFPTACPLQGHLAHKKLPPPGTLQQAYAYGPTAVMGTLTPHRVPLMYSKKHLPDKSSGARAVAPTSSRGEPILAWLA